MIAAPCPVFRRPFKCRLIFITIIPFVIIRRSRARGTAVRVAVVSLVLLLPTLVLLLPVFALIWHGRYVRMRARGGVRRWLIRRRARLL